MTEQETIVGYLRQLDLDKRTGRVRLNFSYKRVPVAFANNVFDVDLLRAIREDRTRHFSGEWEMVEVKTVDGKKFARRFVVSRIA